MESSQKELTLYVKAITGSTYIVKVAKIDNVQQIKREIHSQQQNIAVKQMIINYGSKQLPDSAIVGGLVENEATLHLIVKGKGGCLVF